jgi:hypothetical protein
VCSLQFREREAVLEEVWGPPALRRQTKALAKAGGTGGATGGFLEGLSSCGGCDAAAVEAEIFLVIVVVGVIFMTLYWIITKTAHWLQVRRHMLKPRGAQKKPLALGPATGLVGVIASGEDHVKAPFSGVKCAAYGVVFRCRQGCRRYATTLRQSYTNGFDIETDSGEKIRIPPGRLHLDMIEADFVDNPSVAVDAFLSTIDPKHRHSDDLEIFPHDDVQELVLRPGDSVEVLGPVRDVVDGSAEPTGYRESAATILSPTGIPRLRVVQRG